METIKNYYNPATKLSRYTATVTLGSSTATYEIYAPNSFEAAKDLHGFLNLSPVKKIMTDIVIK